MTYAEALESGVTALIDIEFKTTEWKSLYHVELPQPLNWYNASYE